jgi:hypothetical protein
VRPLRWTANLTDADVADLAGLSCYIERFPPDGVYGAQPVLGQYTIQSMPFGSYLNCPDAPCPNATCPPHPQRACIGGTPPARPTKVGVTNCSNGGMPCDCVYDGAHWLGLPAAGECTPGMTAGADCYWRVLSTDAIVPLACVRAHGCGAGAGGCPPDALAAAFNICKLLHDQCTPGCKRCDADVPASVVASSACNAAGRLAFDPSQCDACLRKAHAGYGWFATRNGSSYSWGCDLRPSTHAQAQADASFFLAGNTTDRDGRIEACYCRYGDDLYVPPPPPSPECTGGTLAACIAACPQSPPSVFSACVNVCRKACTREALK